MLVKESTNKKSKKYAARNHFIVSWKIQILIFILVSLFSGIFLMNNVQKIRDHAFQIGFNAINQESVSDAIKRFPSAYIKGKLQFTNPDRIDLDIKYKNFAKLEDKKNKSLKINKIIQEEDDFVPAELRFDNKTTSVELRIKGDNVDHLIGDKWSFRIKTKGDNAVFGMRVFSLQNPYTRGFQGQFIIDSVRKKYGLLSLRRRVVELFVNGDSVGLMELEEHFSKELLESNGRKESVIVRFDEGASWNSPPGFNYKNTIIDTFRDSSINKSSQLTMHRRNAIGLLRGFVNSKLDASEVFDSNEMGMFLAINQLFGSQHGVRWGNMRFYYNPYTGKLQPIGYDDNFHERQVVGSIVEEDLFNELLSDKAIYESYINSLKTIIDDIENKNLISELQQLEDEYTNILLSEFYLLQKYDYSDLEDRADYIKENILSERSNNTDYSDVKNLFIFIVQDRDKPEVSNLEFVPLIDSDLVITGVKHEDPLINKKLNIFFESLLPIRLDEKSDRNEYKKIENIEAEIFIGAKFVIESKSGDYSIVEGVEKYYPLLEEKIIPSFDNVNDLLKRGIIKISDDTIVFNKGHFEVGNVVILNGFKKVLFNEGTSIKFNNNSGIISLIPMHFNGNVQFQGDKATGGWLYILNTDGENIINGLSMTNVGAVKFPKFELTGALSIYNSPVIINDIYINNVSSEDAINIISSEYEVNNCSISDTDSDAIDADFSFGKFDGCKFRNIGIMGGGDAIDISGNQSIITNSYFEKISDKAISAGEMSNVTIKKVVIQDSSIGIASKDSSIVIANDVEIINSQDAAIMAYIKKKEYGGAEVIASQIKTINNDNMISDMDSLIELDGVILEKRNIDIEQLYKEQ